MLRILSLIAALLAAPKPGRDQKLLKLIDRQTQIASLLTAGKLAYDSGDYATAAAKWEALLKVEGLPEDIERAVKPLIAEAKGNVSAAPDAQQYQPPPEIPTPPPSVTVAGTISGGGSVGPGGAVITLRRIDGWTPKPAALTRPLLQKEKRFVPHVLAVPVGSMVNFKNEDEIFHNVFSLNPKFDTGLSKAGVATPVKFDKPGVVELLCNIHATMIGYLVVVDSPWYAVADGSGAFSIKNVPPGEYDAQVWHENAAAPIKKKITVAEGAQLAFTVPADKRANPFPPDKYGRPRQQQLGY